MNNDRQTLLHWAEAERIEAKHIEQAIDLANAKPSPVDWLIFLKSLFIWLGAIALCSGVIFFFAYNWNDISRMHKFAMVELLMAVSVIAYLLLPPQRMVNVVGLMVMCLLTGAALALMGQTYQTGADTWQLFAVWTALIIPWVLLSRASSLWILWLTLLNLSFLFYLEINRGLLGFVFREEEWFWVFALVNTLLLIFFELNQSSQIGQVQISKYIRFKNRIAAQVCVLTAGFFMTCLAFVAIFDTSSYYGAGLLAYIGWVVAAFYFYRYQLKDLFVISFGALSVISVIVAIIIESLADFFGDGAFLLLTSTIILLSSGAGIWLRGLAAEFAAVKQKKELNHEQ